MEGNMKNKPLYLFVLIAIVIVVAGLGVVFWTDKKADKESDLGSENGNVAGTSTQDQDYAVSLAKYMTGKGMVMYGAYWCAHCQNQKKIFGNAFKYVDYVECDASGPSANPDECIAKGIEGYPTWTYDGQKYSGEKSLSELSEIVGYKQNQ